MSKKWPEDYDPETVAMSGGTGLPAKEWAAAYPSWVDWMQSPECGGVEKMQSYWRVRRYGGEWQAGETLEAACRAAMSVQNGAGAGHVGHDVVYELPYPPRGPAVGTLTCAADVADRVTRRVAELPDRTSPENWPEAMLVTADELRSIINEEAGR